MKIPLKLYLLLPYSFLLLHSAEEPPPNIIVMLADDLG